MIITAADVVFIVSVVVTMMVQFVSGGGECRKVAFSMPH